jgi:hypothetical protein
MIKSMTGYGRACGMVGNLDVTVELRCVNHRYLDISVKSPRLYSYLEDAVKGVVSKNISRGKMDIFISIDYSSGENVEVTLNRHTLEGYLAAVKQMTELYGLKDDITASVATRFPDVFFAKKEQEDADTVKAGISEITVLALNEFSKMREIEGQRLHDDILTRLNTIRELVETVEKRSAGQIVISGLPIRAEPTKASPITPVTSFSRSWRNLAPPPPTMASNDNAMPHTTNRDKASIRRWRANSTRLHAIGGADEASSARSSPSGASA